MSNEKNTKPAENEQPALTIPAIPAKPKKASKPRASRKKAAAIQITDKIPVMDSSFKNVPKVALDESQSIREDSDSDDYTPRDLLPGVRNQGLSPDPPLSSFTFQPQTKEQPVKKPQPITQGGPAIDNTIDQDLLARNDMIIKLRFYAQKFPKKLPQPLVKKIEKLDITSKVSDEELNKMVSACKLCVANSSITDIAYPIFLSGIGVWEALGQRAGLKLNGLTATLAKDESIRSLLDEIAAEYFVTRVIKPEYRLLLVVLQSSYVVHRANQLMEQKNKVAQQAQAPTQPDNQKTDPFADVKLVEPQDNIKT